MFEEELLEGATPLDPEDAVGLLPSHISTRAELNEWEQVNILRADAWALSHRRRQPADIVTVSFAEELHQKMFDATWQWAGAYRKIETNLGVPPRQVRVALRERLRDARTWLDLGTHEPNELAARLHYQLVVVHPWPNGNGRWARLMADALLHALRKPRFTWGRKSLARPGSARQKYLAALKAADQGNFQPLFSFVRQ